MTSFQVSFSSCFCYLPPVSVNWPLSLSRPGGRPASVSNTMELGPPEVNSADFRNMNKEWPDRCILMSRTRCGRHQTVPFCLTSVPRSWVPLCRLNSGVGQTHLCPELCLRSNEDSVLEPVVSSVVIPVELRLYFQFSIFISLYGRQKKSEAFWTDQQVSRDFLFF